VRDDDVAKLVNQTLGQSVVVHYSEHRGIPTSCFGETNYYVDAVKPGLLVVDSVQTMSAPGADGVPGGVNQVRAVAAALVAVAKERGIATVLVGHVTKDGQVAGPRVLEHLVDVVLQFEGDKFSSLRLDDGPLTVYDLERLRRGPRRLVLPSCDSGVAAAAGADEVLGLASSLIPLGTTGIVASVVPVNDPAAVPLMIALHRELRAGASLAEALRDARRGLESDPVAAATGWSFICLGS